jgi:alginate O-acetyltransferase complex protein AlgI
VPQFLDEEKKRLNADNLARGIYIFVIGLAKKVLIADVFGMLVSYGYGVVDNLNAISALLVMLSYTFQIYFDFSGYCDMAIGIGQMMNIDLPQNFNSPYKALTITEFWDRWHMTLTRFFKKYVYIPLGGSRKGKVRTYINVLIIFLISGFWHGASWNFVFWGLLHGIFNVITRMFKVFFEKLHPALNWLMTFVFVNVAWVFFRAETFTQATTLLKKLVSWEFDGFDTTFFELVKSVEFEEFLSIIPLDAAYPPLLITAYFVIAFFMLLGSRNAFEKMQSFRPTLFKMGVTLILLVWSVFSLSGISTFLYFNF